MINKKMEQAINDQIQKELYSSYLYLAMSLYAERKNLKGFAQWLKVQHTEEQAHAMKFVAYLQERGGQVALQALQAPPVEYGTMVALFEDVLAHEHYITKSINDLYELAGAEKDYAAQIFLQWFIEEQVEEEASVSEVLDKMRMIPESSSGIFYFDKALGKRQ